MPTYSYRCTKCEKTFDVFHSMMCKDSQFCPECGGDAAKLLSASSVIFKGSGFYSTDYRDSGYLEAKKKDGNGVSKPAESKPDASAAPTGGDTSAPAKKAETPASSPTPSTPASPTAPAKASPQPA